MSHSAALPDTREDMELSRRLRDVAVRAAESVHGALLEAFRSPMRAEAKADFHDLVTIHDKATEQRLIEFILGEVPDSKIVGEEGGSTGNGAIEWYIDPVDGTSNFARGLAFWCVSIGAIIAGQIVAGAVFDPVSGQMFSADLSGAWCNGAPIRSRAFPTEQEAVLITGYPVERDFRRDGRTEALEHFAELTARFSTLRRPGSAALSICHVAAGWCDAAAGFGVNPWDVTAAILILRKAGGDYRPLRFGKVAAGAPDYLCPGYIALGQGANYPTLMRVAGAIDAFRSGTAKPAPEANVLTTRANNR
jgi:myo-inositol-1(or 4)-monophosphatase